MTVAREPRRRGSRFVRFGQQMLVSRIATDVELIFEIVLQLLGELLLQLLFELAAELGAQALAETFERTRSPVLATIGFVLCGALAAAISLLFAPRSLIHNVALRRINLLGTPLLCGAVMTMVGRERGKRGGDLVRLDRFGYGFTFALSMATVRYLATR